MFGFRTRRSARRRGVVIVQVAVFLVVLIGFAAITVDVGAMYNARNDLQRTADAAALAAAQRLTEYTTSDPLELARTTAAEFVRSNAVFGKEVDIDMESDVVFGRANYNAVTNTYSFTPTTTMPDAVRVRVRMAEDAPNAPMSLFFAQVFGHHTKDLSAEATAMLVPRDIAVVADLSASHSDDSELRHYQSTEVNLFDVWAALPVNRGVSGVGDGVYPIPAGDPENPPADPGVGPGGPGDTLDPGAAPGGGQVGPTFGWMYYWGTELDSSYNPTSDPGLIYLPRSVNWTDAELQTMLNNVGYSDAEVSALMNKAYDGSKDSSGQYGWTNRVAVALGLARWDSGIPGGLWESVPVGQRKSGNNNAWPAAAELTWLVPYPYDGGSWSDYIYNYMRSTSNYMYDANPNFRYRFGVKTFVNYLQEKYPEHDNVPDFADTPQQPMKAVKDSVHHMMTKLYDLETDDHVSLEVYGTTARHEVNLTNDYFSVSERLMSLQAGHYDTFTNIGGGIQEAIEELSSGRARPGARKVIILLTDGKANVNEQGETSDYGGGRTYALSKAQAAATQGIRIYTVSVGSDGDQDLMRDVAEVGAGEMFHAEGSIEEYSAQLDQIFETLGGRRPVELIQ